MKLSDLIYMARVYTRDLDSNIFEDKVITMFLNQGIDRIKQYNVFKNMPYLVNTTDSVYFIPEHYQYIIALFASSRLFETDERFHEGIEKRNEFESTFLQLIDDIESGNIIIKDQNNVEIDNNTNVIEYIKDEYFGSTSSDTESEV